MNTLIINRK